tara:strand:+ start:4619 stop:4927 length:309 start_codon:yes stop_codon:yes gene_type:complete
MNKIKLIKSIVAEFYDISVDDMDSKSRKGIIPIARSVASKVMRDETPLSLKDIGNRVGGKDYTTVIHSLRKAEYERQMDIKIIKKILHKHLNSTDYEYNSIR